MTASHVAAAVEPQQHREGCNVAQRLIQLRGMQHGDLLHGHAGIETHELESPRQVGRRPHDLRIAEVSQTHQRSSYRYGDHDAVEPPHVRHTALARRDPHADQHTDGGAVAGHAAVAYLGDDGPRFGYVVTELVKETVADAGAEDGAEGDPDESRLDDLRAEALTPGKV